MMMMKTTATAALLTVVATLPSTVVGLQTGYLSQITAETSFVASSYDPYKTMKESFAAPEEPAPVAASTPSTVGSGPSAELLQLWSNQVSVELAASQLYLSASIWFRSRQMKGMAAWMLEESDEERGHGLAILEFANQAQYYPVVLQPLEAPKNDWTTPVQVWESILQAEQTNTQNLLKLAHVANACGEYGALAFLNPFHTEQIEAEDKVGAILAQVSVASPEFMMELDHQLGLEAKEEEGEHGPAPETQVEEPVAAAGFPARRVFGEVGWADC